MAGSQKQRRRKTAARAGPSTFTASGNLSVESQAYVQLIHFGKVHTALQLVDVGDRKGNGLASSCFAKAGQVLMRVPRSLAFILNGEQGLQVPEGRWPRLREGVAHAEPLQWDVLFALALVDGLAGDGDTFWRAYCQAVLPPPEALTLPMCWSPDQLRHLQHPDMQQAALAQQARWCHLFPHLSDPSSGGDSCSWPIWAFACVRSRAFRLGEDHHAFIPFLDLVNHEDRPNADFRVTEDAFELFATRDISSGQEVTISYCGEEGYSNQRWMATYGFVPQGGNSADRIALTLDAASTTTTSYSNVTATLERGRGLRLARLQDRLGDTLFLQAISGQNARLFAALRSLPWLPEDLSHLDTSRLDSLVNSQPPLQEQPQESADTQPVDLQQSHTPNSATDTTSLNGLEAIAVPGDDSDVAMALALRQACRAMLEECGTPVGEEDCLSRSSAPLACSDSRAVAATTYRRERILLLKSVELLLDVYIRDEKPLAVD